jgi:DNA repair exonuclease SbcCD ATPase subunit
MGWGCYKHEIDSGSAEWAGAIDKLCKRKLTEYPQTFGRDGEVCPLCWGELEAELKDCYSLVPVPMVKLKDYIRLLRARRDDAIIELESKLTAAEEAHKEAEQLHGWETNRADAAENRETELRKLLASARRHHLPNSFLRDAIDDVLGPKGS